MCSYCFLSLFSGKTYLEMLTVGGNYASITVEVIPLSSFLIFISHIASHRSHCLQLWHGWLKRCKNFSNCWPDCTYRQGEMILVLRGALKWIFHGIPIHFSGIDLHNMEWQRTKTTTAFLSSNLFMYLLGVLWQTCFCSLDMTGM